MRLILTGVAALGAAVALSGQGTFPPVIRPPTTGPGGIARPPQAPPVTVKPKASPAAEVTGRVVDRDGRPIGEAGVWLVGAGTLATVPTDVRGRFTFPNVAAGEYVVLARKRGFYDGAFGRRRANGTALPVTVSPGQALSDMQIELFRSGVITGSVLDEANEPIIGARVVAVRRFFSGAEWQYVAVASALTDDQGVYRVYGLEPGEYLVSTPTAQLNVEIPDEQLVAPAMPHTESSDLAYPTLFYAASRYSILALPVQLSSGEVRHAVNFQWAPVPARAVRGRLIGTPDSVRDQIVKLIPLESREIGLGHEVAATLATPDGEFLFERVPAGEYRLEAGRAYGPPKLVEILGPDSSATDQYFGRAVVNVVDEDVKDLAVRMNTARGVSGVIQTERGGAPGRVSIAIVPAAPGLSRATAPAITSGRFTSVPIIPGDYYIRVTGLPPGWYLKDISVDAQSALDEPASLAGPDDPTIVVSLTNRPTVISGSVRDARMLPATGAAVAVLPASGVEWSPNRSRLARASMNGQFAISGLPAGDYLIVALDDAVAEGLQDERMISQLRTLATRVSLRDAESKIVHLRLSPVRR